MTDQDRFIEQVAQIIAPFVEVNYEGQCILCDDPRTIAKRLAIAGVLADNECQDLDVHWRYEDVVAERAELEHQLYRALEERDKAVRDLADEWESRNPSTWARFGTQRAIQASRECHAEELRAILEEPEDPDDS